MPGIAVASLVHGLDGLFLPPSLEVFALARHGTPEHAWAAEVMGERCLPYRPHGPWDSAEALLIGSDIAGVLRRAGVRDLLLTASHTPMVQAWAEGHDLRLWTPPLGVAWELENKLHFHALCQRVGLPTPAGGPWDRSGDLPGSLPLAVQLPRGSGGEGTWLLRTPEDALAMRRTRRFIDARKLLVRELVDGSPCGATVLVTPTTVALSAVRRQCFEPDRSARNLLFTGVQWIPTAALNPTQHEAIESTLLQLGRALHRRRFLGTANIDFMLTADGPRLLECNARLSAATPQILRHPETLSGPDLGQALAACFVEPAERATTPELLGLPRSTFEGASYEIVTPASFRRARCARIPPNGRYSPDGERYLGASLAPDGEPDLCLVSLAQPDERIGPEETLATALSTRPLYDGDGRPLPIIAQIRDRLSFNFSK